MFFLQNVDLYEWAMLGSNQRPPPCKGQNRTSGMFTFVQKVLQTSIFFSCCSAERSPLFTCVVVKLSSVDSAILRVAEKGSLLGNPRPIDDAKAFVNRLFSIRFVRLLCCLYSSAALAL